MKWLPSKELSHTPYQQDTFVSMMIFLFLGYVFSFPRAYIMGILATPPKK